MRIAADQLKRLTVTIFRAAGAEAREATITAEHLVEANLAGHDSHGVLRILQYVPELRDGKIVPGTPLRVLDEWHTGLVVDARGMFGQVGCHEAMQRAIDKARRESLAAVTIRHSNHSGRLGTYVAQAAAENMIGMVMANGGGAGQWVAPFGGRERRLSTNPLAIGAPSGGDFPFLLDISTSVAPEGKVRDYWHRNQQVPDGWLVDHRGQPTNDPGALYAHPSGALLPFGGTSGHKAYGLAFMVDVLAGALAMAGCPRKVDADASNGTGLFLLALDVSRFAPLAEFLAQVQDMANYVKTSQPAAGFDKVLVPGEWEFLQRQCRERDGVEIPDPIWDKLNELADQLGVSLHKEHDR